MGMQLNNLAGYFSRRLETKSFGDSLFPALSRFSLRLKMNCDNIPRRILLESNSEKLVS